jgi:mRNA-degrading endonuclease toxin of MazEF toxin-antitoxin module
LNKFNFIDNKISFAILSQIKSFDANRLERKIGKISKTDFIKLKEKLKILLKL